MRAAWRRSWPILPERTNIADLIDKARPQITDALAADGLRQVSPDVWQVRNLGGLRLVVELIVDDEAEPAPTGRVLRPCGTHAAYVRHKARGEAVCDACLDAERTYQADRSRARRARKAPPRELQPCGTVAAHRRHVRRGEQPCDACAAAYRVDNTARVRSSRSRAAS